MLVPKAEPRLIMVVEPTEPLVPKNKVFVEPDKVAPEEYQCEAVAVVSFK